MIKLIIFDLFISFFKTGLLSFGGGYAMISMLCDEAVKHNWMSRKDFFDIVAVSQITPGPIAINMATFVGFKKAGILGAIFTTLGVSLPSFILVLIFLHFINKFRDSFFIKNLFYGIKPAVVGLVVVAIIQIAWTVYFPDVQFLNLPSLEQIKLMPLIISFIAFIALYKFNLDTILAILIFAIIGIIIL